MIETSSKIPFKKGLYLKHCEEKLKNIPINN